MRSGYKRTKRYARENFIDPATAAAVGSALGPLVTKLFSGGQPSQWANAGANVHEWFTKYGEEAFLQWVRANYPDSFGSLDGVKMLRFVWAMKNDNALNNTANPVYMLGGYPSGTPNATAQGFRETLGIDLPASQAAAVALGFPANNIPISAIVMVPGGGTPNVPQPVVDEMKDAASRVAAGQGTEQDRNLLNVLQDAAGGIVRDAARGAAQGINEGGGVSVSLDTKEIIPYLLGGLALLLLILFLLRK